MPKPKIALIGLGLIGKSIGKALRVVGGQLEVVGHDREPLASREAQKVGAVDKVSWNLIETCEGADIVIMAMPLQGIEETLKAVASDLKPDCLVMDTANLKVPVMRWADELLPEGISFVGGDPILGDHTQFEPSPTDDRSRPDLLKGTLFCLTPSTKATAEAIHLATDLVRLLEANPFFLDAAEHDGLIAGVEQLPVMLVLSLVRAMSAEPSWREMRKLAGPAFEDMTRILSQEPASLRDMLLFNGDNAVRLIDSWLQELYGLRASIRAQDHEGVQQIIEAGLTVHERWLKDRGIGLWEKPQAPEVPTGGGLFGRMLGLRGNVDQAAQKKPS
jgi:prephenate dehydrogenase